jgi:hypothetical protein
MVPSVLAAAIRVAQPPDLRATAVSATETEENQPQSVNTGYSKLSHYLFSHGQDGT